jgi:hypothetical protein
MEDDPRPEPERPRFLLPPGCKDLIDTLRLAERRPGAGAASFPGGVSTEVSGSGSAIFHFNSDTFPTIAVPETITVSDLAAALDQNPLRVIESLTKLGLFVTPASKIEFDFAFAICAFAGKVAIKMDPPAG